MSRALVRQCVALMTAAIDAWERELRDDRLALFYATREPGLSCFPKNFVDLALAYSLSPLTLVPESVPLLGWMDRKLFMPALLWIARTSLPARTLESARERASAEPVRLQQNTNAAIAVAFVWLAAIIVLTWLLLVSFEVVDETPFVVCAVGVISGVFIGTYVRAVVYGETIFGASSPLGVVEVGVKDCVGPPMGSVPLMKAEFEGSGV